MPGPFARLGRIVRTHGLDGGVVLAPRFDLAPDDLVGIEVWVVPPLPTGAVARTIVSARHAARGVLVWLDAVDSVDRSRPLVDRWLLSRADVLPPVPADDADVIGYAVVDEERGLLGTVADTIVTGANDVLVVAGGPFGEVLVPVIESVVLQVRDETRTIAVRLLPGLIDEGSP